MHKPAIHALTHVEVENFHLVLKNKQKDPDSMKNPVLKDKMETDSREHTWHSLLFSVCTKRQH